MVGLKEKYRKEIVPKLIELRGYKNIMEVPGLDKIVVNMGLGEAIQNVKILDSAVDELAVRGEGHFAIFDVLSRLPDQEFAGDQLDIIDMAEAA